MKGMMELNVNECHEEAEDDECDKETVRCGCHGGTMGDVVVCGGHWRGVGAKLET